jgi:hypothetical protein
MAATFGLRAIPWAFIDHDLMKIWVWRSDHFEARITADINSFSWEILDLMASPDGIFLTEGRSKDFNDAENEVREAVAKSYPPKYGYAAYAGPLATTFTIATGERVDFGTFAGMRAIVTVRLPNGNHQSFLGTVRVVHYEIHLTPDTGQAIRIQPAHIVKVAGEGGTARTDANSSFTGMGRIYKGKIPRGCTGKPGFLPDTIDHTGDRCPVHEDSGHMFG